MGRRIPSTELGHQKGSRFREKIAEVAVRPEKVAAEESERDAVAVSEECSGAQAV
jgi:hypothetical protein